MSTGEHLVQVLNTLETRAVVLEEELKEIADDLSLNATLARKYGGEFFTEGEERLLRMRAEKQEQLADIRAQLHQTTQTVSQGRNLLGALSDDLNNPGSPPPALVDRPQSAHSPTRILTSSPILSERHISR